MTNSTCVVLQSQRTPLKRHRCHNKNNFTTNAFSIHGPRHTRCQQFSTWACSVMHCHTFTRCFANRNLQTTLPKHPEISTRSYATRYTQNQPISWQITQLSMKYNKAPRFRRMQLTSVSVFVHVFGYSLHSIHHTKRKFKAW